MNSLKTALRLSLSLLAAVSLTVSAYAAPVSVPQVNNFSSTGIPAECGDGAFAQFFSTSGMPLVANLNQQSASSQAYAGIVILAPNQAADPLNLASLNPIPQQGNLSQVFNINNPSQQGDFTFFSYVAYSFVNRNGVRIFGVSQVPTAGVQNINNHTLKGKSASLVLVTNTDLAGQRASLQNLTGAARPGAQATNFQLLGISTFIYNNGATPRPVSAAFNNFVLNSTNRNTNGNYPPVTGGTDVPVGKDTQQGANLNCNTFVPFNNQPD